MNGPFNLDPASWLRLRQLLDQALDLPPGQRADWLAGLGPDDQALQAPLARLIEQAGDDTPDPRFDALPPVREPVGTGSDDEAPELPPDIGPYRPLRLLGEGGMSRVWLAERTDVLLNRPVALKLPRATWRDSGLALRMAQEREILAVLDHPNIARIYDAGVAPDGQPYLALEYVEGQPIDVHCRAQHLDLRARVTLFLQVADAVAHAHAKLVVHRDLKPSNILVSASGQVRLLDFGIAKLVGEAQSGQPALTQNAARVMTPHYAAPEQMLGLPISTATDIYALGVVLYELLSGERPYRLPRETAAALEEAILHGEPLRPSATARDTKQAKALRGDLDTILLKALKKKPEDRYGTVTALADDLRHWLAHRPVLARPDGARYRALKYLQRNRLTIGVVGAVMLALSAGLAAALWQSQRARQEAAKATAIKDYLIGLFEANDIEQRDGLRRRQQSVQQLLEDSVNTLDTGLADQPEVRDELQRVVGGLLDKLSIGEAALRLRQMRVRQLTAQDAAVPLRVQAWRELSMSQMAQNDPQGARRSAQQGLQLCTDHALAEHPECLSSQVEAGRLDFESRKLEAAWAVVEPATRTLRRVAPDSLALATAVDLLGMLALEQNRADQALALQEESIAIKRSLWGAQSVRLAMARFFTARNLWNLRHLALAEAELRASWDIVRDALGPEHATSARIELYLGRLTAYLGLKPDGLAHLQHASEVILRHADSFDPYVVLDARVAVANALVLDGRLADAGPALREALALRAKQQKSDRVDPTLDQSQGRYLLDLGRYDEALAWLEDLRSRTAARYGADHPETAERSLRVAQVLMAQGRLAEAGREIDMALASQNAREAAFGSVKHRAQLARAAWLLEQGDAAKAQPVIDAQLQAARQTPRENQYRDVLYRLHDLSARAAAALGQHERARADFEQALALMRYSDALNPYVAATRARYALTLIALRDPAAARVQIGLADAAVQAQPELGEQFRRPVQVAHDAVVRLPT